MKLMKRLGLVGILGILGTLLTASPALAKAPQDGGGNSSTLMPPETDPPEPLASGKYTVKPLWHRAALGFEVYVTCWNLTPGKQYTVCVYDCHFNEWGSIGATANSKGKLSVEPLFSMSDFVNVWVENDQGAVVLLEETY